LKTTPTDAVKLRPRNSALIILLGTALLQTVAIVLMPPALSDDALRYRADGKLWLLGESPYAHTPARLREIAEDDNEFELDLLDAAVPFQDIKTIYLPVSQGAFAATAALELAMLPMPQTVPPDTQIGWRSIVVDLPLVHRLLPMRLMCALCVIGCASVLITMLHDARRSVWWAVLLAWNPLTISEAAGNGHQDWLGILLVLIALRQLQHDRGSRAGIALGLAALVKPHVLILLPFMLRRAWNRHGFAKAARQLLATSTVIALVVLAVMPWQNGFAGWFETMTKFAGEWEANGLLYRLTVDGLTDPAAQGQDAFAAKAAARAGAVILLSVAWLVLWITRASVAGAGYVLFTLALAVSPVAYPWYLGWSLALVPLISTYPRLAGLTVLTWSATIVVAHNLWDQQAATGMWRLPYGLLWWQYAPVFAVALLELSLVKRQPMAHQLGRRPIP
ncbi:MAG: glycosyltransferase 87 family protein, partial [Planctomycetota bacterium]